jgi:hypothetical protein
MVSGMREVLTRFGVVGKRKTDYSFRMLKSDTKTSLRKRVFAMVEQDGLKQVSKAIGVGSDALARFLADLPVRAGTLALIQKRVGEIAQGKR